MKSYFLIIFIAILCTLTLEAKQTKTIDVPKFDRIIISPHISANLVQGCAGSVEITTDALLIDKVHVIVQGKILRIYLDDARVVPKLKTERDHLGERKRSISQCDIVHVNITHLNLATLSVRGAEQIVCDSPIHQDAFKLKIYGESEVHIKSLNLDEFNATIYGEGQLQIEEGKVAHQNYILYGESNVRAIHMENHLTRICAYGESRFKIRVSDYLKVTAFGEADIIYLGTPSVRKGIIIGDANIRRSDSSL